MKKIFSYFEITSDKLKHSFVKTYRRNSIYSNIIIRSIISMLSIPLAPKKNTIRYFFWGSKYSDIIKSLPREEVCILGGPNQLKYCIKHRYSFIPIMDIWALLYKYLGNEDEKYLNMLNIRADKKSTMLMKYKSSNCYLILNNDNLPMHRFMLETAKRSKIITISIQHGIFNTSEDSRLHDGWTADYFLTINQHQTDLLTQKGMPTSKLITMGFHSILNYPDREINKIDHRKICFLGQPFEKCDDALAERYYNIVQKIQDFCLKNSIDCVYKPHPWEEVKLLPKWINNIKTESLDNAFNQNDVFISLTSTALFEASWINRVSIQIYDKLFETDRYSELENIITIDYDTVYFEVRLYEAINSPISNKKRSYNSSEAFLKSIALIENKNKGK